jgi:glycosyltransferase involved in cell wall biosynthesis
MPERTVHLHVGRSVHPVYHEQLHALPAGFRYRFVHPGLADPTTPTVRIVSHGNRFRGARTVVKRGAMRVLSRAGYVRVSTPRIGAGADLVHSAQFLLRNPPAPYVVDFEQVGVFALYQQIALERPWARRRLVQAILDDRCRHLLPWSETARQGLLKVVGERDRAVVAARTTAVLPAIRPAVERPRTHEGGALRVLFVGTAFYEKGAVEAVRAVAKARETHDVQLDLVSYVPDEWQQRLAETPGVTAHAPARRDFIERLYAQSHVLLFPSHMDTFGYVVLEAMAHGLPVAAPGHLALNELIEDGASGVLFATENPLYGDDGLCRFPHTLPPPRHYLEALKTPGESYVDGIAAALVRLAEDRDAYDRLAAGALDRVRSGPLSMDRRREQLARIYTAAIG